MVEAQKRNETSLEVNLNELITCQNTYLRKINE